MAKKAIEWTKIKTDYLNGATPKELAEKYDIEINKIYKKVENDKWAAELREIKANIGKSIQEQVTRITNKALRRLENVLDNEDIKVNDLVSAIGKALDISGLKAETLNVAESNLTISVVKKD